VIHPQSSDSSTIDSSDATTSTVSTDSPWRRHRDAVPGLRSGTDAERPAPITTVVVSGRLDALAASRLRGEVSNLLDEGVIRIVVDLTDVTFVDSAGLAALAGGMKHARAAGGDLRIARSPHPDAARIFRLTRFDQIFRMAESVDSLVASW